MINHSISRTGNPPVDINSLKNYVKYDDTGDEDYLLQDLLDAAVIYGENLTGQQINDAQSIVSTFIRPAWDNLYRLKLLYVNSTITITSVEYVVEGSATSVDSDDYWLEGSDLIIDVRQINPGYFKVTYTVACSDNDKFKLPLYKTIADAFVNRENQSMQPLALVEQNAHKYFMQFQDASQWI